MVVVVISLVIGDQFRKFFLFELHRSELRRERAAEQVEKILAQTAREKIVASILARHVLVRGATVRD